MFEITTLDDVRSIATPDPTETHQPIPHGTLIDMTRRALGDVGYRVESERYELANDGARMFSTWAIVNGTHSDDYRLSVGLRNAHDKAFAAGMGLGTWVLVCSNLDFAADFLFGRKHTPNILRDLPDLVRNLVGNVPTFRDTHERRLQAYRRTSLSDVDVHDVLIRSVDSKVMATSYIAKVLEEWRSPQHEEFKARNVWSLMNAYTEVFKSTNIFDLSGRTRRLHGLLEPLAIERGNDPQQITLDVPKVSTALVVGSDSPFTLN